MMRWVTALVEVHGKPTICVVCQPQMIWFYCNTYHFSLQPGACLRSKDGNHCLAELKLMTSRGVRVPRKVQPWMPIWTIHPTFAAAIFHKLRSGKYAKEVENRSPCVPTIGLGSVVIIRASAPKPVMREHEGSLSALRRVWPGAEGRVNPQGAILGFVRVSNIVDGATSKDP